MPTPFGRASPANEWALLASHEPEVVIADKGYEKKAANFLAFVKVAAVMVMLK